jgi:hypothetical protein
MCHKSDALLQPSAWRHSPSTHTSSGTAPHGTILISKHQQPRHHHLSTSWNDGQLTWVLCSSGHTFCCYPFNGCDSQSEHKDLSYIHTFLSAADMMQAQVTMKSWSKPVQAAIKHAVYAARYQPCVSCMRLPTAQFNNISLHCCAKTTTIGATQPLNAGTGNAPHHATCSLLTGTKPDDPSS